MVGWWETGGGGVIWAFKNEVEKQNRDTMVSFTRLYFFKVTS